jgi:hypothetical protein
MKMIFLRFSRAEQCRWIPEGIGRNSTTIIVFIAVIKFIISTTTGLANHIMYFIVKKQNMILLNYLLVKTISLGSLLSVQIFLFLIFKAKTVNSHTINKRFCICFLPIFRDCDANLNH